MSKYIIFSDIHLHTYQGEVDSTLRLSKRLLVQKDILQQVLDLAIQEEATILFGGDLVHSVGNIPVEVINMIHWFFEECKKFDIKLFAVSGNHDQNIRKNGSIWHDVLSPFQNREQRNNELSKLPQKVRFVDWDDENIEQIRGFDLIVAHKQPTITNKHGFTHEGINWRKVEKNNKFVFYGHYHTTTKLSQFSYIIGSPLQLTMNDSGEDRGCWLVNSEDWSVKFIKLDYPELKKQDEIEAKEEDKFEERIKSTSFQDILQEWLKLQDKPASYLEFIQKDITDKLQVSKTFFTGKIKHLSLVNFLSFEELDVDFKNGFYLINGNIGAGKTTIVEGIYWILFDDSTKGLAKNEVIRNRPTKQKDATGMLKLVDDKDFYTIKRSAKDGLEVFKGDINLVEGMTKPQAQEFLERNVLGFDKFVYLTSCYFSQKQLIMLSNLGDSEKTSMITNLLGFEVYDDLHELMDSKIKELTLQDEELEKESVKLENDIWKNNEQQKNLKEHIECSLKTQCSLNTEHSAVTIQIGELTTLLGNIVVPTVTTEEIDKKLLLLNGSKVELSTKQRTLQEDGQKKISELRTKQSLAQTKLRNILQEQNDIDKERVKIETVRTNWNNEIIKHEKIISSLKENKCSYCGTILNAEELKKHIVNEQNEIKILIVRLEDCNPDFGKELDSLYDLEAQTQEDIRVLDEEIKNLDAENKSVIALNFAEITKIECDIQELQVKKGQAIKEQTEANIQKVSLTSQIKQLEQRKASLSNQLQQVSIDDKLTQLKDLEIGLLALNYCLTGNKEKITVLNENKIIYEFWKNAFSNKGIRPLLLDAFCNGFNSIVKTYCQKVSKGLFMVEFTPTSETKKGEARNKIGINVLYKGKPTTYEALSGGESTLVNVPIAFALNKWIALKYGVPNGILGAMFLDEIFGALDRESEEKVASLLVEEGQSRFIGAITHTPELSSWTNNYWNINKENDISNIQVI